jgi:hypothetical protein
MRRAPPAGATEKLVSLIVVGFIAMLNVAVINLPLFVTPFVLVVTDGLPLVGSVTVTVGIVAPAAGQAAPGAIAPAGAVKMAPAPVPKIGSRPPPPHPAATALSANAMNHGMAFE